MQSNYVRHVTAGQFDLICNLVGTDRYLQKLRWKGSDGMLRVAKDCPVAACCVRGMIWYDMIWYGMVWYGMVWYGMVWYGMVWYGMVWYGMVWYGVVWYGKVWCAANSAVNSARHTTIMQETSKHK